MFELGDEYYDSWNSDSLLSQVVYKLKMTADWTEKQCKLLIYYKEGKMNKDKDYTMLLPELEDKCVWYPCVSPYWKSSYCIIRDIL